MTSNKNNSIHLWRNSSGAIIVEATIYFPIVLFVVMALIYLALFKLQESVVAYAVQRTAAEGAIVVSNPGYERLGDYSSIHVDLSELPDAQDVANYYENFHSRATVLYREFGGPDSWLGDSEEKVRAILLESVQETSILPGMQATDVDVTVRRSLLGTTVTATVTYTSLPVKLLEYFGLDSTLTLTESATAKSFYAPDLIRHIDLGCDAVEALANYFGFGDTISNFTSNFSKIRDKIF